MTTLSINGRDHSVDVPSDTPLLWVIREHLQMTGTKFGCGAGFRRARTLAATSDHHFKNTGAASYRCRSSCFSERKRSNQHGLPNRLNVRGSKSAKPSG
jgi:hypothetical protein